MKEEFFNLNSKYARMSRVNKQNSTNVSTQNANATVTIKIINKNLYKKQNQWSLTEIIYFCW